MQTRTITVDYARPRGYDVGYRAENNFTLLALPVPEELENADSYRVYFESTVGDYLQTETLTPVDGYVTVKITSDVVPEPGNMAAQLVAFADGEIVGYAPMITGSAKVSIPDGTERLSHSLAAEIALNTAARHSHSNKAILDKFAETGGKPTYAGQALGGGGGTSDFIIKMTVEANGDNYTVTSCDATVEQIDAAVSAEKRVVVIASAGGAIIELPMVQGVKGDHYYFGTFLSGQVTYSFVQKVGGNTSEWQFSVTQIEAESVDYSNAALPNISTVGGALDALVPKSHTHSNKSVLDKFAESDGKPTYDGEKISGASTAEEVEYTNAILPDASNVKSALDDTIDTLQTQSADTESLRAGVSALINAYETQGGDIASLKTQAHTHSNKDTLDKLSDANGKLQYNGSDVGLKGDKGDTGATGADGKDGTNGITPTIGANGNWYLDTTDTGKPSRGEKGDKGDPGSDAAVTKANVITALGYTPEAVSAQVTTGSNITLADNTEYRLTDVTTLTLTYPTGDFECWMRLNFAASGDITVTLPAGTGYIGTAPDFKNGETWELSFKDKILVAQKVGDGT